MKKICLFMFMFLCSYSFSQNSKFEWDEHKMLSQSELNNIMALADCYGYVRFFYPNPNFENFDWTKFLMYSVDKVKFAKNDDELKTTLNELFSPLCAQISFSTDSFAYAQKLQLPFFAVEHKAIGTLAKMMYGKKYSPIVTVTESSDYQDIYCYKLKENLYVNFPVAIKKLPEKTQEFNQFKKKIDKVDMGNISLLYALLNRKNVKNKDLIFTKIDYRIADIIIRRNFIQHFYPYFSEDRLYEKWDSICINAIYEVAQNKNINDYYSSICKFLANINDSHMYIWNSFTVGKLTAMYIPSFYPNISLGFAGETCFVGYVGKEYEAQLQTGDIVLKINNIAIDSVIKRGLSETSSSSKSYGLYKLLALGNLLESSKQDSVFDICVKTKDNEEKNIKLTANLRDAPFVKSNNFVKTLDNNIIYINGCSDSCIYDNFKKIIPLITNAKGVIFDLRGYPKYDMLSIISNFINEKIELGNLLQPIIRFPNQKNIKYNVAEKWSVLPATSQQSKEASKSNEYTMPLPIHFDKPMVFLIDGKVISFGETFADMMKYYKVGTLIGTHTAGCNGDITRFDMLCLPFLMTYNKFLNRDGSQHHGIGVLPDIECEMKISDIHQNIDTQLEKAKEFLQ